MTYTYCLTEIQTTGGGVQIKLGKLTEVRKTRLGFRNTVAAKIYTTDFQKAGIYTGRVSDIYKRASDF